MEKKRELIPIARTLVKYSVGPRVGVRMEGQRILLGEGAKRPRFSFWTWVFHFRKKMDDSFGAEKITKREQDAFALLNFLAMTAKLSAAEERNRGRGESLLRETMGTAKS